MKQDILSSFKVTILFLLLFMAPMSSFAQKIAVSGHIVDDLGEAIIGANVRVKGTNNGTTSDIDGNFKLNIAKKGVKLVISYTGYKTEELTAEPNMKIVLSEDNLMLDDVVVIGYGAVKKKEVTGAVAQVKADEIDKIVTSDLGDAMQGLVAGVSVTAEDGAPGAASNILIRGVASVNGQNTPLYVVDGVPQEGDPRISPNEVESIDILKDAASCAIYGTRGAAGVILITTKKGDAGKLKVKFDASYSIRKITSNNFLMNSTEQTYHDLQYKEVISGTAQDKSNIVLTTAPGNFHTNSNQLDMIFVDNAAIQNYTLNISGGNKGFTYSLMGGYYNQEGSIINSGFDRFNTRANLGYSNKKFSMTASLGMSIENTENAYGQIILQSIKLSPLQSATTSATSTVNLAVTGAGMTNAQAVMQAISSKNNLHTYNSFANIDMNYELFKGFKLNTRASVTTQNGYRKQFCPFREIYDSNGELVSKAEDSYVSMNSFNRYAVTWDFGASYTKTIKKHKMTAFVGVTGEQYVFEGFTARKEGVRDNSIEVLNGTSINPEATSSANYVNKLLGSIARLQYDWRGRYLLSASLRRDGSSRFSKDNTWGYFPSASAAWNVSDEPFFAPLQDVVNNFKMRASYGTTGNQNFTPYTYTTTVTNGYDYVLSNGSVESLGLGTIQSKYSNPDVKWETTKQWNYGIDLAFLNNKLTFAAEYYTTDKDDMLFPVTLPSSTGTSTTVMMNVGNMTNHGYEITARWRSRIGKVNYNFGGTFSSNTNKVTKINGEGTRLCTYTSGIVSDAAVYSQVSYIAEGYEVASFFLYPTEGIINTEEKLAAYKKIVSTAQMGDLMFKDTNGDGKISDDDRVYCGSGLPKFEIGFNAQALYKNFDLYVNLYSALGHEVINGPKAVAFGYGRHKDLLAAYSDYNTDSSIPTYRGQIKEHDNYRADTDLWIEDGSYLRLKTVTLGYTLPKNVLKKLKMSQVRFYISGQNMFTWTKYSGYDPAIGGNINRRGLDLGNYPTFATYLIGTNISF